MPRKATLTPEQLADRAVTKMRLDEPEKLRDLCETFKVNPNDHKAAVKALTPMFSEEMQKMIGLLNKLKGNK
jgi:hypothetical protein